MCFLPQSLRSRENQLKFILPLKILSGNYRLAKGSNEKKPKDLQKGTFVAEKKPESTYERTVKKSDSGSPGPSHMRNKYGKPNS